MSALTAKMRYLLNRSRVGLGRAMLPRLVQAQREVLSCSPIPYYTSHYHAQEAAYWLPIPGWLHRDYRGQPPRQVLDIGCGYGTLAVYCRLVWGCPIYCLDINPGILSANLASRHQLHFTAVNIELDPLPWSSPFDIIILTEVLEHFNFHPLPTLSKLRQAMAPGGRIYLSTPDAGAWGRRGSSYSNLDKLPLPTAGTQIVDRHIYLFTLSELHDLALSAGFVVTRVGYAPGVVYRHINLVLQNA